MNVDVLMRTIIPILLQIGAGYLSRKLGVLRPGDERVLSAYVYYFALPALFFVNMAETDFTQEAFRFVLVGIVPVLIALAAHIIIYLTFKVAKETLYLLIVSTVFGSLAFFGIPFITFAFPNAQAEKLATLASASISLVSVALSITVLELYRLEISSVLEGLKRVARRLSRNPLVASIFLGTLLSLIEVNIPIALSTPLHMLGSTTSTVAIFMLGVFLYGRKYANVSKAFRLSLLRIVFLPTLAMLMALSSGLPDLERAILVLMHSMPVAVSMIVLSERYDFSKETIASLILISSLGAGIYLNLWLYLLSLLQSI